MPTTSKLASRWESGWTIDQVNLDGVTRKIVHDDGRTRVVHINRLQKHIVRNSPIATQSGRNNGSWEPPVFQHEIVLNTDDLPRRSQRHRQPPDRYGFS